MKRLNANISSTEAAFEQTPKVFQPVRVNASLRVALRMVDYLVLIFVTQFVVRFERVRENVRSFFDVLANGPSVERSKMP
jgi:hypothetical protein